ncbi:MAG: SurA N-terminal domain-containing protein [Planctomycetes bacterium]|nr:SurA N-terminal domain-containing protein [Planctomycetota bacterium]
MVKFGIWIFGIYLGFGIWDLGFAPAALAANQVVARVNGEILTEREVNLYAKLFETDPKNAIQIAINDKLILQEALKDKIKVTADEVESTIKERVAKIGLDRFTKIVLEPLGMTMDDYRQLVRDQLTRERYIQSKIGAPSTINKNDKTFIINNFVSPREIKEYFESHKQEFATPARIKTRQIILK